MNEYIHWDATDVAAKIRDKEISPEEALNCAIEQIEKWNPHLNAVVLEMYDEARRLIRELDREAPFYGVPFLLKDIGLAYKGYPLTGSCRALQDHIPDYDSELAIRYRRAGLIVMGKTNVPEAGLKGVTDSAFRGVCRNPWSLNHTPGGSSGGAAAAVAARIVPVAHGNDGGGSIRIPASCCGLVGLKPSRGRMPMGPKIGESWMGQVADHVLTRSVRDSAALLDLTHGADSGAPYGIHAPNERYLEAIEKPPGRLKIAYSFKSLYGKNTHPVCRAALENSLRVCRDLGHELVEEDLRFDRTEMVRAYMTVVASAMAFEAGEIARLVGRELTAADVEPGTWTLVLMGRSLRADELASAIQLSRRAGRELGKFFERHDLFMAPTLAYPPTVIGELDFSMTDRLLMGLLKALPSRALLMKAMDHIVEESFEKIPNTELFNQTGNPAISLPLYWDENNLPIGTQFAAAYGREDLLLRIARQLEQASPWHHKMPVLN